MKFKIIYFLTLIFFFLLFVCIMYNIWNENNNNNFKNFLLRIRYSFNHGYDWELCLSNSLKVAFLYAVGVPNLVKVERVNDKKENHNLIQYMV